MRLSWAQGVAGVFTCAVVAGLLLLPGRLLGPDRPIHVAVPPPEAARSVQAAPPLVIPHLHRRAKRAKLSDLSTPRRFNYVPAQPRAVVHASPARKLLQSHRSAVIQKLAPTAPLVRARVLAAITVPRHVAPPASSSTAKTIAALAASLGKK